MNRSSLLEALRRFWWVAVLFTVGGLLLGAVPAPDEAADGVVVYRARHTILVSSESGNPFGDPVTTNQLVLFTTTGEVPRRVADALGFESPGTASSTLSSVTLDPSTGALKIESTADLPDRAELIADTFASELATYIAEVQTREFTDRTKALLDRADRLQQDIDALETRLRENPDDTAVQAELDALSREYSVVYEQQYTAQNEASGRLLLNTLERAEAFPVEERSGLAAPRSRTSRGAFGLIVGSLVGLGVASSLNRLDRRIRTVEQAEEVFGGKASIVVPHAPQPTLVATADRHDPVSDAYRTLRSVLSFARGAHPFAEEIEGAPITLIVSPGPGDGKTSTAIGLAVAMAEANRRTIAVNTDFRRPTLGRRLLGDQPAPTVFGLAQLAEVPVRQLLRRTRVPSVVLLDLTGADPSPGNLARSTARMLTPLTKIGDEVVVDTSPVGATAEVLELLPFADNVVVTVRVGHTTRSATERTMQLLRSLSNAQLHLAVIGGAVDRVAYYGYGQPAADTTRSRRWRRSAEAPVPVPTDATPAPSNGHAPAATTQVPTASTSTIPTNSIPAGLASTPTPSVTSTTITAPIPIIGSSADHGAPAER